MAHHLLGWVTVSFANAKHGDSHRVSSGCECNWSPLNAADHAEHDVAAEAVRSEYQNDT